MRTTSILVCLILLAAAAALRTFVQGAPETDFVKRLPGQPKVPFKQYAGYVTVDKQAGRALFYYFVEAELHASSKPLTLWLNGGPGCSSVGNGAFEELGPFRPNGYGRGLVRNFYSWNKVSNLLFLESPAGVGFSYSNTTSDYSSNDAKTAQDSMTFLLGWFEKFPEYKNRDFFLSGESYAGHYIPQLASLLLQYNKNPGTFNFILKGVAIGNPLLSLAVDSYAGYDYWWSHGLISEETFEGIKQSCNFDDYEAAPSNHNESFTCNKYLNQSMSEVGDYINDYDVILDVCTSAVAKQELRLGKLIRNISLGVDVCIDNECEFYMNLHDVQKDLHANTTHLAHNWTLCSSVLNYTYSDLNIEISPYLVDILQNGIRLWVYSGDLDSVIPLIGTRLIVRNLATSLKLQTTASYRAWYRHGQVAGWTVVYENLTYATVRGAGHLVPLMQPARSLMLFEYFIKGNPLPLNQTYNSS